MILFCFTSPASSILNRFLCYLLFALCVTFYYFYYYLPYNHSFSPVFSTQTHLVIYGFFWSVLLSLPPTLNCNIYTYMTLTHLTDWLTDRIKEWTRIDIVRFALWIFFKRKSFGENCIEKLLKKLLENYTTASKLLNFQLYFQGQQMRTVSTFYYIQNLILLEKQSVKKLQTYN